MTHLLAVSLLAAMVVYLAQAPSSIWNLQGSVTVVGVLAAALFAFYFGLISTGRDMREIKGRLEEREEENATLHKELMANIEQKAELRGELTALRYELQGQSKEIASLRQQVQMLREER